MTIWRPLGALTGASAITLAICLLIPMLGTQRTPPLQPEEITVPLVPLPAPEQQTRPKPTTAPTAAPLMRAPAIAMPKLSLPTLPAPQQTGGVTLPAIIGTEALSLSAPSAPETGDLKVDGPAYDTPPRVRTRIDPFYPPSALRAGVQGSVLVRVLINEEGRVTEAHVVRSEPAGIFDASALKAVRRWRFYPAKRFGNPVAVRIDIPIRFRRHR